MQESICIALQLGSRWKKRKRSRSKDNSPLQEGKTEVSLIDIQRFQGDTASESTDTFRNNGYNGTAFTYRIERLPSEELARILLTRSVDQVMAHICKDVGWWSRLEPSSPDDRSKWMAKPGFVIALRDMITQIMAEGLAGLYLSSGNEVG